MIIDHWTLATRDSERCAHVRQASLRCQRRLRRRLPRADEQVNAHGNPPLSGQGARQHFTLVVASLPQALGCEGDRDQRRGSVGRRARARHRGRQIVGDPWQGAVLERVNGVAGAFLQPDRGSDRSKRGRPLRAQAAGTEVRLRLPATLAPGRAHRSPPLSADGTQDSVRVARHQQRVTEQAFRREKQLLDDAKHGAPAEPRRA